MYFAHKLKVFSFNFFLGKYIFCQEGETKGKELPNYMSSICELLTSYSYHVQQFRDIINSKGDKEK